MGAGLCDGCHRLEEFLTSLESLGFLGRLMGVFFFSLAILSFLVGILREEVDPAEKLGNQHEGNL